MRALTIFAVGLALSACVSRETVYQRSLATPHPDLSQSDFDQIAEVLSHRTHQSITKVERLENDEVRVHAAFPGEQGPGSGDDFVLVKRDGKWHMLNATNIVIE
jgi:hypothetical protein